MQIIIGENSTIEWNPLIFAIFYQKLDIVKYFCNNLRVYVRNCLISPFLFDPNAELNEEIGDEKFVKFQSDLYALVLTVMLKNGPIMEFIWNTCSYIWSEMHLILLTNYLFESKWVDGILILFRSKATQQIIMSMNTYEKLKYIKFCEKSALRDKICYIDFE